MFEPNNFGNFDYNQLCIEGAIFSKIVTELICLNLYVRTQLRKLQVGAWICKRDCRM